MTPLEKLKDLKNKMYYAVADTATTGVDSCLKTLCDEMLKLTDASDEHYIYWIRVKKLIHKI